MNPITYHPISYEPPVLAASGHVQCATEQTTPLQVGHLSELVASNTRTKKIGICLATLLSREGSEGQNSEEESYACKGILDRNLVACKSYISSPLMIFSSIYSVVAMLAFTIVAQPIGRYLYEAPNGEFTLGYDINEDKRFAFFIATSNFTFGDFFYPLIRQGWTRFAINLKGTGRTVDTWYAILSANYGITPRPGDLAILTFKSYDSLFVSLGGRKLKLFRVAFPIQAGTFTNRVSSVNDLNINYTIGANGELRVAMRCDLNLLLFSTFNLIQNDISLRFRSYYLSPTSQVLRDRITRFCPSMTNCRVRQSDLTNVVFTYWRSLYITLGGRRITLFMSEPLSPDS